MRSQEVVKPDCMLSKRGSVRCMCEGCAVYVRGVCVRTCDVRATCVRRACDVRATCVRRASDVCVWVNVRKASGESRDKRTIDN